MLADTVKSAKDVVSLFKPNNLLATAAAPGLELDQLNTISDMPEPLVEFAHAVRKFLDSFPAAQGLNGRKLAAGGGQDVLALIQAFAGQVMKPLGAIVPASFKPVLDGFTKVVAALPWVFSQLQSLGLAG